MRRKIHIGAKSVAHNSEGLSKLDANTTTTTTTTTSHGIERPIIVKLPTSSLTDKGEFSKREMKVEFDHGGVVGDGNGDEKDDAIAADGGVGGGPQDKDYSTDTHFKAALKSVNGQIGVCSEEDVEEE